MMKNRAGSHLVTVMLMMVAFAPVRAVELLEVELQKDVSGAANLMLNFDGRPADLEVSNRPSGVEVRLPGTTSDSTGVEDVELIRSTEGIRLNVNLPGSELDGVEVRGSTVTIRLGAVKAANEDVGYRLGAGDVVTISVYRHLDLSGDFTILQDGTLLMPLAGPVSAAGLTVTELVARLKTRLSEFIIDPQLGAGVKAYQSQFVVVTGAVQRASRVALHPKMSLEEVLSTAGVALTGDQEVVLTRENGQSLTLSASDLEGPGVPRDGDVLTVQDPEYIFITGEVRRPDRFVYTEGLTLQEALTLAGGLTEWASKKEIRILRPQGGTKADEVINLKKVESRRIPDPKLEPGDLIVIRRRVL
jgi:polysaccharide export outer membrane protein